MRALHAEECVVSSLGQSVCHLSGGARSAGLTGLVVGRWVTAQISFSRDVKSVGFDAGTLARSRKYLTYGLQAAGIEVVCLEAGQTSRWLQCATRPTGTTHAA
jgi:hypothetical protein